MADFKESTRAELIRCGALMHGDFTLYSGERSSYYIDVRKAMGIRPQYFAWRLCETIREALPVETLNNLTIAGVAEGGIAVMQSVICSYQGGALYHWNGGWIRKDIKKHGVHGYWAGADLRENVVLVEDVITSGASAKVALERLNEMKVGCVRLIACVVNRNELSDINGVKVMSLLSGKDCQ